MATRENETKVLLPRPRLAQLTHRDEQLRQTFQEFLVGALCPSLDGHRRIPFSFSTSAPDVDLYEENNEVVVKAELPGMEKDDIQIGFTDHQLSINTCAVISRGSRCYRPVVQCRHKPSVAYRCKCRPAAD